MYIVRQLPTLLLLVSLKSCARGARTIEICQGGACSRNGASTLLHAAETLTAGAAVDGQIRGVGCLSLCGKQVVCRVDGALQKVSASGAPDAIASASELVAVAGHEAPAATMAALNQMAAVEELVQGKELTEAVTRLSEIISVLGAEALPPAQDELPAEPIEWEGSVWSCEDARGAFGAMLRFEESATSFEFGSSDDGTLVLTDCTLGAGDADEMSELSGYFESDEGTGEIELSMSDDGRSFAGSLTWDEDGSVEAWSGTRLVDGAYGESPPAFVRLAFEALVARSRARAALGEMAGALADAQIATRLCCRAAEAWEALADAEEGCTEDATTGTCSGQARQMSELLER